MKAIHIVNRLKEIFSKYTEDFSTILNISSLVRSGSTITCTTSLNHNLTSNDYVTIKGAKEPIQLSEIKCSNGIATAITLTDHKLSDPSLFSPENLPLYIEISGATGYNGVWELLTVPSDLIFTFKVTGNPADIFEGNLLLEDQDGYNGYKQIIVTGPKTFTYQTTGVMQSPALGTIKASCVTRIDYSATSQRINEFYTANANSILQTWAFVVLNQDQAFKNDTIIGDSSTAKISNESYWNTTQQNFSIYVIIPAKTSILGGDIADKAREYRRALLKAIVNYKFPSDLEDEISQPAQYVGSESDDYIQATYTHRYDFTIQNIIQTGDTTDFGNGSPLKIIDGIFKPQNLTFKTNVR
jgi:hypothetical protein